MQQIISELKSKNYNYFVATHYAPKTHQNAIAAILFLKNEIETIPKQVSEPMIAEIRLEWWRTIIAEIAKGKPPRPHPALKALEGSQVSYPQLLEMVDNTNLAFKIMADILGQEYNGLSKKSIFCAFEKQPTRFKKLYLLISLLFSNHSFL